MIRKIVINFMVFFTCFVGMLYPQKKAIDFTLNDLYGNAITLSESYKNNIILLDFWATWCIPCVKGMVHFQTLYDKYQSQGLEILAINVDGPESVALVKNFMNRYKYTFPVLMDSESNVLALYNPQIILPYTMLIDRQGNIQYVHQGYSAGDEIILEQKIIELLESKAVAEEKKLAYYVNEAFLYRHFSDQKHVDKNRDGRASQILNQLNFSLAYGDYLVGLRWDANLNFSPLIDDNDLAKRFFEMKKGYFSMRLGDFYSSIGRGLVFSLLKTFEKEGLEYVIDTTVDGGKLSFNQNQYSVDFFGGWIDRPDSDLKDEVITGAVGWQYQKLAKLQLNYLYSHLEEGSLFDNKNVSIASVGIDAPQISDYAKFYGEFALIQRDTYYSEEKIDGHGLYLESGFFKGNVALNLAFNDYKNLNYEYNRPPLLESEQLEILANQFDTDATDITGIAARIDYDVRKAAALIYGKFSHINDSPEDHYLYGEYERKISHFFAGVEHKFKSTGYLNFLAGYRMEDASSIVFLTTNGNTFHYQFNISYPLNPRFSLEFDWKSKDFKGEYLDYYERRSFLSLHYSPWAIVSILFEQTTDPEIMFLKDKKNWWAGQLEVKFLQANSIRIFIGSTKGGVKCSGGLCRFFPPFEGFRLEAILRF